MAKTRKLVSCALLIAISFIGANVTLAGSIAFDSLPAFLATLMLGPVYGAAIGFLGHLLTAATSGFPLSIPLHIVIAFTMALTMLGFGYTYKLLAKKIHQVPCLTITGIIGVTLNVPVSLMFSVGALWILAGRETAFLLLALIPILLLASILNVVLSIILFKVLQKVPGIGVW